MKNIFIGAWSWSEHKVCAYQSTVVYNFFLQNEYTLVWSPVDADLIILNWYPFEEFEEKVNLLTINYYLRKYPDAKILLIGSIPAMMPYMSEIERVSMIGWRDLIDFDNYFSHSISIQDIEVDNIKFFSPLNLESLNIDKFWYQWRNIESNYIFSEQDYHLSIDNLLTADYPIDWILEYGIENNYLDDISWEYPIELCTWCGGHCSYCDIRTIAGFVKSIPIEKILVKIRRWLSLWFTEFHFIDEDSASYWLDIWLDFADLLNEINKIPWDFKIRIFYFEPGRLERLYDKIEITVWNRIKAFCLPLQTTSQRILKLMNRNYNIENVLKKVISIQAINPKINISTQFIYGFPTETFDEFKDYFKTIVYFSELWFWYYSDRRGTHSLHFEGKISRGELSRRMIFLWRIKEKFTDRIFDKNQTLKIGLDILKARNY